MRMALILASLSTLLISCASLNMGGETTPESPEAASLDGGPEVGGTSQEMSDASQAPVEIQAAEQQIVQAEAMNEQRSTSELDAAAPEVGTDTFHASTQTPGIDPVVPDTELPTQLPEKTGASWDQQASAVPTYETPQEEKPIYKKSKKSSKVSKKRAKNHSKIAKRDKKSTKRDIAKVSKKSKKSIAQKSKSKRDCKKIVKGSKKSTKKAIAMCKADKNKMAHKGKKIGKVANASGGSSIR